MMLSPAAPEKNGTFLLIILMLSVTIFIKFGIPIGGNQLFAAMGIIFAAAGYGFVAGYLEVQKTRLMLYALLLGGLALTQIFNYSTMAVNSFIVLCMVHLPYIFTLKKETTDPGKELVFYQKLFVVLAFLGIFQFFIQYIIGDWAFFLDAHFPQAFIVRDYHGMNALEYEGTIYKPTAFFLQEPSNFSQLLAFAIIIEVMFFKKLWRLALYVFALIMTFSGTGILLLLVLLPIYLVHKKHFFVLIALTCTLVTAPVWAPAVGLGDTVSRATEIQSDKSSAYARFVSPFRVIAESPMLTSPVNLLFGNGAGSGSMKEVPVRVDYERAGSTWSKIFYEYGILGFFLYVLFMGYIVATSGKNRYLCAALLIMFVIMGEYLFPPTVHALILAFIAWPNYRGVPQFSRDEKREPELLRDPK